VTSNPRERFQALQRPYLAEVLRLRAHEGAASGIVRRDPFLDDELLRTVASLPAISLLHGDFTRGLFRETIRGAVPDSICTRETKARFEAPSLEMTRAAGGFAIFEPLADVRKLADWGLVEPRPFRECFDKLARGGPENPFWPVWPVLALEAFLRDHDGDRSWRPQ
jgi:hypothetical protein